MSNLRAGLIGLGMMGRHHARVLDSLEGVDLVAMADPGGDKFGVTGERVVLSSVEQLIEHQLDYCVVAAPTAQHEEITLALADAGIHALVEKPLSFNRLSAERMANAYNANGLLGGVGHIERYNAALQQARARIEAGELGDIYQVSTRRQGPFPGRISDVGVINDLGTHDFDLTAWVTQQSYRSISAKTAHKSGREHEDLVAITAGLSSGAVVNHLVSWLSPFKERTTVILGENGTFVADTLTADLTFFKNGNIPTVWNEISQFRGVSEGDMIRYSFPKPEPLRTEHENFRDAVVGKSGASIVTFSEGLETVKVAGAAIESARTGSTVAVF